jgi:hypothetical protein
MTDPIDFTGLTGAQERVLGLIAMNEDGGHHPKVLAALVKRGLIEEYEETLGGGLPMRIKRYRMPLHVHIQWCQWCSDSFDEEIT